jgi:hypothetical protein
MALPMPLKGEVIGKKGYLWGRCSSNTYPFSNALYIGLPAPLG